MSHLMTISEVAELFRVSVVTVRRLKRLGRIPAPVKVCGQLRWVRRDIEAFAGLKPADGSI